MNLGENIKKARKASGITQKQLADKIGAYQKDVSRWEKGEHTPNIEAIADICNALNVSADILLGIEKENK